MPVSGDAMLAVVEARSAYPFEVLGPHPEDRGAAPALAIRAFLPDARRTWVVAAKDGEVVAEAQRLHDHGFFEAVVDRPAGWRYRLRFETLAGAKVELDDPYAFGPMLGELDLHLLHEGTHLRLWERLGAHLREVDGVRGVHFAVWAPNARRVSVVGDFNVWDGRRHPMRFHPGQGIWELFIPGLVEGETYKFELLPAFGGPPALKSDPFAFQSECPPKTASRVRELGGYAWGDAEWMARRAAGNFLEAPISVYEVHLGSWRREAGDGNRSLSYRELAEQLGDYVKQQGYTHVELLPITEHPYYPSWGYQPVNFFAPTARYGDPHDLMALVDALHQRGIGVLLDWVPAHFPADAHGLATFDGTHLYEHADPRQGQHPDWKTLIFNYGRTEVAEFLIASALFWLREYHFDGLRVDAVASMLYLDYSRKPGEWVPNRYGGRENLDAVEFLKRLNTVVHGEHPGVLTIAEESTAWPAVSKPTYVGGLGFSLKWNMGWMHDTLDYFSKDPIYRKHYSNKLTFAMMYAYAENYVLALSHDEVVHGKSSLLGKMPGDAWQKRANLRALLGFFFGHPGKKLHFMGAEFGQWREWDHDGSLDWHLLDFPEHRGLQQWVRDLNHLYASDPALHRGDYRAGGFRWVDCTDVDRSVYSWLRAPEEGGEPLLFVGNFTPIPRPAYRIGVPRPGIWREILNSDAEVYGGSNMGNYGQLETQPVRWHEFDQSLALTLPPLSVLVLRPDPLPKALEAPAPATPPEGQATGGGERREEPK